jgi:hypothetical protein
MVWDLAKNILENKAEKKAVADRCCVWYLMFTGDNFSIQSVFGIIRNIQTERVQIEILDRKVSQFQSVQHHCIHTPNGD